MAAESTHVRLFCMLLLTFGFFIVEVVVSRMTASLSMLSDSFHMLSDVIALVVALIAVQLAEKTQATNKNTFGWIRAEVMGALVNAVFLTALCFTIVLEAIEHFTEAREIESPELVAGVGAVGLAVNLLGLCLFHEHAGLPRGYHSHRNKKGKEEACHRARSEAADTNSFLEIHSSPRNVRQRNEMSRAEVQITGGAQCQDMDHGSSSQLNTRGVFLHMLGDVLGSVIVVVNAVIFTFVWQPCEEGEVCVNPCGSSGLAELGGNATPVDLPEEARTAATKTAGPCWVLYLDPTLCLIMVSILLYTTFPLLKESALILLQTVPKQINIHRLIERLLCLEGVLAIHELHIWQLAGSRIIATAHIKCQDPTSYMEVAKRIKDLFHDEGIHATTIQPEFVTFWPESQDSLCELSCQTQCAQKLCCGSTGKQNALSERKASNDRRASDTSADGTPEAEAEALSSR